MSIADDIQETVEDAKEAARKREERKERREFVSSWDAAAKKVRKQLEEEVDLGEEARATSEQTDRDLTKAELRAELKVAVREEMNKNREQYRATFFQNLKHHEKFWDDDLGADDYGDHIDDLLSTAVEVWTDNHLDEFVEKVREESDDRSISLEVITAGGILTYEALKQTAADVVRDYGSDAVDWFLSNTSLSGVDLIEALTAFLRAFCGM